MSRREENLASEIKDNLIWKSCHMRMRYNLWGESLGSGIRMPLKEGRGGGRFGRSGNGAMGFDDKMDICSLK